MLFFCERISVVYVYINSRYSISISRLCIKISTKSTSLGQELIEGVGHVTIAGRRWQKVAVS